MKQEDAKQLPLKWRRPNFVGANILIDTNVWVDNHLPHILLASVDLGLFQLSVSEYVMGEWLRNHEKTWVRGVNKSREELAEELEGSYNYVDSYMWNKFVRRFKRTEPKDKPVAASAKAAGSNYIMSFNYRDYYPLEMRSQGIEVYPPDAILSEYIYHDPYIAQLFANIYRPIEDDQDFVGQISQFWNYNKKMPMVANALTAHPGFIEITGI